MRKNKKIRIDRVLFFLAAVIIFLWRSGFVYAGNPDYQRCKTNSTCTIGEFLYNDEYSPITDATCTLTSRDPSGNVFLNSVSMTAHSDGWYSYSLDTTGATEGLYRSQMCCTSGSDYLCLDKSFYIGPSYLSTSDVAGAVWNAQTSSYNSSNTFGANLQNAVTTASEIWGYSSRTLSSFGTLVADIWDYSTRSLTSFGTLVADIWNNTTRTLTGASLTEGELATKSTLETATGSAVLSIKTVNDYDLGDIIGYIDTLETVLGTSSDTSSSETVFGKIAGVKETVDQLSTIDTNIDSLISKWGSYDAEDIYDKVKNLSSEISAINTVSNVSSILSLSQTNATNMTELKNKVAALKAVVDVNRILLEKVGNQPVIKTWIEEGSMIFKTLITNPSKVTSQTVPLKYYLPQEVKKENIVKIDEGLGVEYDATQEAYFVSGEFTLEPGETKILSVEVEDIWKISQEEIDSLQKQTEELTKPLKGTSYFAQGMLVKSDIQASLDKILRLQKEATTPQGRIRAFREAKAEMKIVAEKLETLKTLVASAGSMGTMFGFIGGVQTLAVWGLIIVLIAGFVFLFLYFRILNPQDLSSQKLTINKEEILNIRIISFLKRVFPKIKQGFKFTSFSLIIFFFILVFINTLLKIIPDFSFLNNSVSSPTSLPTLVAPTPLPEEKSQEIEIKEEKQVLGLKTSFKKFQVLVQDTFINIRKKPSLEAEIIGQFKQSQEVIGLEEVGDWVKLAVYQEKDGVLYSSGWVHRSCLVGIEK